MSPPSVPALDKHNNKKERLPELEIAALRYAAEGKEAISRIVEDLLVSQVEVAALIAAVKPLVAPPSVSKLLARSAISILVMILMSALAMMISAALGVTLLLLTATTVLVAVYAYGREMRAQVVDPRYILLAILFTMALAVLTAASLFI